MSAWAGVVDRFAERLLAWFDLHGRKDLPWQQPRTPYRVWLSEVMLQQTQVASVIGYFERFAAALPGVRELADAPPDRVLALWAGLGYYSRARNLQRAAQLCVERHGGELPRDIDALQALPGIGRSTAAAIVAQAWDEPHAILDGNARRALARHAAISGDPARPPVQRALWAEAEARLPRTRAADYTQAIMDLGATVCRVRPACDRCPVAHDCIALRDGRIAELPGRRTARVRPARATTMLLLHDAQTRVLLERRAPSGIWGGLWSLPECAAPDGAATFVARHARATGAPRALAPFVHEFTHFTLSVAPLAIEVASVHSVADGAGLCWATPQDLAEHGTPAPVRSLLLRFWEEHDHAA